MSWGTVALTVLPVPLFSQEPTGGSPPEPTGPWSGPPGKAKFRIDGLAKVTGDKIYARDFRVADMVRRQGWPASERMAMVIRAEHADRVFESLDLGLLGPELQPETVVTQAELNDDGIGSLFSESSPLGSSEENRAQGIMVAEGKIPAFLGQPLAILIFEGVSEYRRAKRIVQFNEGFVRYGEQRSPAEYHEDYQSPLYLTLYPSEDGIAFSQTLFGYTTPSDCSSDPSTKADCEAKAYREKIDEDFANHESLGWTIYDNEASTQVLDPMFMEPEAGLAWYDRSEGKVLHLLTGTQAPFGDISDALDMFGEAKSEYQLDSVTLTACYPGGGFGGRDTSPFPPLLILAAMYAEGPVRMANDRFEQFQSGIKQLGADIRQSIAVDGDGRFQALRSSLVMRAGGKNNYSQYVAELAGYCAGGGYWIPRASIDAGADPSVGVIAGSMRGFGGPQAFFGIELLVEKVAADRGEDSIDLRIRNALSKERGDVTVTGAPLVDPLPIVQICERAKANPIWAERAEAKKERSRDGVLYGVGFGLSNQAFGTGKDGVMAAIAVEPDGSLLVHTNAVDMGNGSATTLACTAARFLGKNASDIVMGQADLFQGSIELSTKKPGDAIPTSTKATLVNRSSTLHDKVHGIEHSPGSNPWADPKYTASYSMSSSACITAFQQVHAVTEASRLLFDTGVWPAAASSWGIDPANSEAKANTRWVDEKLTLEGQPSLDWTQIASAIHGNGKGIMGAMVHACFQAIWIRAKYVLDDFVGYAYTPEYPCDGIALRRSSATTPLYQQILRKDTIPPPENSQYYGRSLYAPAGTLAAVEVSKDSGRVRVVELTTYLDAGTALHPEILEGIYQGGATMGIGYTLLEDIPLTKGGAGIGRWNLDKYHVALSRHVPIHEMKLELIPPSTEGAPAKGIAEAVLCPIAPAIANAVNDATGLRFTDLPITPEKLKAAWRGK